ncbi:MAG TPA: NADP-dependent oxidoreductase [Candidatus Binatus sp.]|nr:NADP-dependent oxidoreductase [Candidatus Binatus sp.]
MQAVCLHARGGPERLELEQAPTPTAGDGEVLVRVRAAAITPGELSWESTWRDRDGKDRLPSIPSHEFCGEITQAGADITHCAVGDIVYSLSDFWRNGAAAEYIAVNAEEVAPKPASIDDVHAAAIPLSGLTALQALYDHAVMSPDQHVVILGASGGVGTFAVQLAQLGQAHVGAVTTAQDVEYAAELGANQVATYDDFDRMFKDVDVLVDLVGGELLARAWRMMRRGGIIVSTVEQPAQELCERHDVRGEFFVVKPNWHQLTELAALVDDDQLEVFVAKVFPLSQTRDAYELGLKGHIRGKIVLKVADATA